MICDSVNDEMTLPQLPMIKSVCLLSIHSFIQELFHEIIYISNREMCLLCELIRVIEDKLRYRKNALKKFNDCCGTIIIIYRYQWFSFSRYMCAFIFFIFCLFVCLSINADWKKIACVISIYTLNVRNQISVKIVFIYLSHSTSIQSHTAYPFALKATVTYI